MHWVTAFPPWPCARALSREGCVSPALLHRRHVEDAGGHPMDALASEYRIPCRPYGQKEHSRVPSQVDGSCAFLKCGTRSQLIDERQRIAKAAACTPAHVRVDLQQARKDRAPCVSAFAVRILVNLCA